jgi:hypothetical protein
MSWFIIGALAQGSTLLHLQAVLSETELLHFNDWSILFAIYAILRGLEKKHGDVRRKWTDDLCRAEAQGAAGVTRRLPNREASNPGLLGRCGCCRLFESSFHCFIPATVAFWHLRRGC